MGLARFIGLTPRPNGSSREGSQAARQCLSLCRELLSERGDSGGLAHNALEAYRALPVAARAEFFDVLATEFSPDPQEVGRSADVYRREPSAASLANMVRTVEPARQELFRRLNLAPGGTREYIHAEKVCEEEGRFFGIAYGPAGATCEQIFKSFTKFDTEYIQADLIVTVSASLVGVPLIDIAVK